MHASEARKLLALLRMKNMGMHYWNKHSLSEADSLSLEGDLLAIWQLILDTSDGFQAPFINLLLRHIEHLPLHVPDNFFFLKLKERRMHM